ncbi:hypothetical protein [Zoogloea ramigera]|uniref:hypothetical protein n=1 Tax=Zoogloea ramigera TaxID=350 RepID=UPI003FA2839F
MNNDQARPLSISSFPNPFDGNPYLGLLYSHLEAAGVRYVRSGHFGQEWLREQRGKIDFLHFHWVGGLYEKPDGTVSLARLAVFVLKIWLARALGYQVIWTAHNLYPHNRKRDWKARLARLLFVNSVNIVFVNFPRAVDDMRRVFHRQNGVFVVPHGNYRPVYPQIPTAAAARAALGLSPDAFIYLLFGGISPYKGAHDAIEAVRKVEGRDALLVVLGQCPSQEYAERLRSLAGDDPRVQLRIGALDIPDDEVLLWMAASNAIVTPYSDIYTSGTLHLTATFGKPMIVPRLGVFQDMADQPFVFSYDPADGARQLPQRMRDAADADPARVAAAAARFADAHEWSDIAREAAEVLARGRRAAR